MSAISVVEACVRITFHCLEGARRMGTSRRRVGVATSFEAVVLADECRSWRWFELDNVAIVLRKRRRLDSDGREVRVRCRRRARVVVVGGDKVEFGTWTRFDVGVAVLIQLSFLCSSSRISRAFPADRTVVAAEINGIKLE